MGIEFKTGSKWWYARFRDRNRVPQVRLDVEVKGVRPDKISGTGDKLFEYSRGQAIRAFEQLMKDLRKDKSEEKQLLRIVEIKTGSAPVFPKLADLPALWEALPRRSELNDRYASQCKSSLQRFVDFVAEVQPEAQEFVAVKPQTAAAFMAAEEARGVAPKTWNDELKLLRTSFKLLHRSLNDARNPFIDLVTKAMDTVNRAPFTVEEMKAILDACAEDDFIRPIIVAGMCSAMRRGDCCLLKWRDVDLKEGFLRVKTSKTGETVEIPIFPMLLTELAAAARKRGNNDSYCFPAQAEMYLTNPDGITWRVKKILAKAFESLGRADSTMLPKCAVSEAKAAGERYLASLPAGRKTERMMAAFQLYMDGKNIEQVLALTGNSKGAVSGYLNEIEANAGCAIVRGKIRAKKADLLQKKREGGGRRASIRDFHSFRVTWITLALAAGVPLELVQRVTGHKTTDVVLKHYFKPGREQFRQAIQSAMPKLLTAGAKSRDEQMLEIVEKMTAKTWKNDAARLRTLLLGETP